MTLRASPSLARCLVIAVWTAGLSAAAAHAGPRLRGHVRDLSDLPIANARIELHTVLSNFERGRVLLGEAERPEPLATAVSDAVGSYVLAAPALEVLEVVVRAPGHVPMVYGPLVASEDTVLPPVAVPGDEGANVRLVDARGQPAVGISVLVFPSVDARGAGNAGWRPWLRSATTGADGRAALPRRAGESLDVTVIGPRAMVFAALDFPHGRADLRLGAPRLLPLEVHDADDAPLEGVLVRAGPKVTPVGLTGKNGRIEVPAIPGTDGTTEVLVMAADGRRGRARLAAPAVRQTAVRQTAVRQTKVVRLVDPVLVDGRVLAAEDRRPLADAIVLTGFEPASAVRTDTRGRYRLTAPASERFWIQAEAAGRLPRARWLNAADLRTGHGPTFALERPVAITGRVLTAGGSPAKAAVVIAQGSGRRPFHRLDPAESRTVADEKGRFRLAGLRPEIEYTLQVRFPDHPLQAFPVTTPSRGQPDAEIAVTLASPRDVFGHVVTADDEPVADALVTLAAADRGVAGAVGHGPAPVRVRTGPAGRFDAAELPAIEVDVEVTAAGFAPLKVRGVEIAEGSGAFDVGTMVMITGVGVEGVVRDPGGEPVEGASIFVSQTADPPRHADSRRLRGQTPPATSDAHGRFALTDLAAGIPISLLIEREGYAPTWLAAVRPPLPAPLRVELEPAHTLAGRVLDEGGEPIRGARVAVVWRSMLERSDRRWAVGLSDQRRQTTGADGVFRFPGLPPGEVSIDVFAAGHVPAQRPGVVVPASGPPDEQIIVLETGTVVEGRVRVAEGGPVENAMVVAGLTRATTDADGAFRFAEVAPGRTEIIVDHPELGRLVEPLDVEPGVNEVELIYAPGQSVRGRVVDETGAGVEGAAVFLAAISGDPDNVGRKRRVRSHGDGLFLVRHVRAGRYRAEAAKEGHGPVAALEVEVADRPIEDLEIVLPHGASIVGRVHGLTFDEIARLRIVASDRHDRRRLGSVDFDGRFEIPDLGPEVWLVEASLDDGQRHRQVRVRIEPGERRVEHDVEFATGVTLSGHAYYDDQPLLRARIALRGFDRAVSRSTQTNYDGHFAFHDLEVGRYALALTHTGFLLVHNETLDVEADRELTLRLDATDLTGRVVDATSSQPLADVLIFLERLVEHPGDRAFLVTGGSDADGTFVLPNVAAGAYRLRARKDGYSERQQRIELGNGIEPGVLELALEPTTGLTLQVALADGRVPAATYVRVEDGEGRVVVRGSRALDSQGRVLLATVPPGTWHLTVGAPGATSTALPVEVPGEPVVIVLALAGELEVAVAGLETAEEIAFLSLAGHDGKPLRLLDAAGEIAARWPVYTGHALVEGLPPGLWTVRISTELGPRWSREVVAAAGARSVLTIP